ncbi:MAG: glycoside hydrolase family 127 protein [Candidatus Lokiarchaeota archaeon]|nr:glycoside hydrolase family 127 protein [Candidatus Harpocratesius repetitus]
MVKKKLHGFIHFIKTRKYQIATFLIILGFAGSYTYSYLEQYTLIDSNWEYPINAQELTVENAAEWASDWFIRIVRSDGSYRYIYYLDKDSYSSSYSYLRHWGSVYSMIYYYQHNPYPELLKAVRKTIDWGLKYFTTFENDSSIGYFFYQYSSSSGGPALALMALTQYRQLTGDPRYDTYISKLSNFLLWMQESNGKIRSMYIYNGIVNGGEDNPFYPSESLLGLTLVYKLTGDNKYLTALQKAYVYYNNLDNFDYYASENTPFIPWSTSAFSELYQITGNYTYADFAFKMIDHRLKSQNIFEYYDKFGNNLLGCISRSVAVSSTLEGLGDCYAAAKMANDTTRMANYEYRMRIGIEWVLSLQMRYDQCKAMNLTHPERAFGGFRHSFEYSDNMTMRNDYTQHTLSALTKYLRFFPESVINSTVFRVPVKVNSSSDSHFLSKFE